MHTMGTAPALKNQIKTQNPEPRRGRKKKHTFGQALGKVPSMRPIKSPRFGSQRYVNMLSSQLETITSSQENTGE